MRRKIILAVLAATLVVSSTFVGAVNVGKGVNQSSSVGMPLTEEDFNRLNEFVNNIEDEELKRKVKDILDQIITDEGELDVEVIEKLAREYYESVSEKISTSVCQTCISESGDAETGTTS